MKIQSIEGMVIFQTSGSFRVMPITVLTVPQHYGQDFWFPRIHAYIHAQWSTKWLNGPNLSHEDHTSKFSY